MNRIKEHCIINQSTEYDDNEWVSYYLSTISGKIPFIKNGKSLDIQIYVRLVSTTSYHSEFALYNEAYNQLLLKLGEHFLNELDR